jgi:NAD(P)-dependent dehydrogenase (short-subunit alcohol dehydrogenase family)
MLDAHVARITGGGTGLGRAAAAELIACGAHVVICGRREEVLRDAVQRLGERSSWVSGDVRDVTLSPHHGLSVRASVARTVLLGRLGRPQEPRG